MNELTILTKSIKDYFSADILKILIVPLIGSAIVLYLTFFSIASSGFDSLDNMQIQIQQHETTIHNGEIETTHIEQSYTGNSIVDFLLKYTITSWILSFIVYFIGIFAIGYLSIFISLIIVGFLTPKILGIIHHKHYDTLEVDDGYGTVINSITKLLKTTMMMLLLFIVMIPFYFIPVINLIAINIPVFYFFHKMLHYDVSSAILSKEKFEKLYYFHKTPLRLKSLFLYSISLIPFVAFFISVFYIVYLGHSYFSIIENENNG